MALTSSSSAVPRVRGGDLCAAVCAVSAGAHGALVVPHVHESARLAMAFALVTVAMAAAAVGELGTPSARASGAVAALLLAVALGYLLSRTTGIPGLVEHPEPPDVVGVTLSALEVAAAALALRHPNPRRH